jgi:hypothetical protein
MRRRKFITLLGGALFACPHFVKRRVPLEHSGINVRIVELSAPPDFDKSFEIALNEQVGARHPRATRNDREPRDKDSRIPSGPRGTL